MTDKEIKIQLALGSLSDNDKYELANNLTTSKAILKILSKDKYWYVRSTVARNPNTPIKILTILSKDKDNTVRYFITKNPNTSIEVLKILNKDKDKDKDWGY